jgi:hypothetical protein
MHSKTLPTLNQVIIKCTAHCIAHLQSTFSLSHIMKVRDSDVFSMGTWTKEDELSTGRVWAAGFHHVTACCCLARILKLMNRLFI